MSSPAAIYSVHLSRQAKRQLRRLPQIAIDSIDTVLQQLAHNPRPRGVVKLAGETGSHWRIRVGSYRVLYEIDERHNLVDVYRIKHRRDAYR